MADVHTPAQRSFNMSRIRGYDTKPELLLRSLLHRAGLRFRKNVASLPGKPDIVFPKHRAVVMIHGCYWHRHSGCRLCTMPKTNSAFWESKFAATVIRDAQAETALKADGWQVFTVWECELKGELMHSRTQNLIENILKAIS
ncbi:MAG TPA: DNA mismatch endonuclease Vsr [Allosphingosinicella sp.]|nr:DNA mismatch endonuclease Vsr [Allosphingosinicella sp.]